MSAFKFVLSVSAVCSMPLSAGTPKPAGLTTSQIPPVPDELIAQTRPYMENRPAIFSGWNARDHSMLIVTRFGNVSQLHEVAGPLMDRQQITFEAEPVSGTWSPAGDVLVATKDLGGDEFYQLYSVKGGRLTLLTDGKSRNEATAWSKDGRWLGYTSTARNGNDTDLYVIDPRQPGTGRMVARVSGGGWSFADFAPDGTHAVVINSKSVTDVDPYILDLSSGKMTPIGEISRQIAYNRIRFAPDGRLWALSDDASDVQRLGLLDPATGRFTPKFDAGRWDVEEFDISKDGRTIAYLANEAGASGLYLVDVAKGQPRRVSGLPIGVAQGLDFASWGELGFGMSSAKSTFNSWSLDPATGKLTRWTRGETGGVDPASNKDPELIEVKSFDGLPISGFLYRPDPARFPGKRPVIVSIHGGPEGQERPYYMGRLGYLVDQLGVAYFFPNVRGSTGYGKRFVSLDNGPFKREDSVRDVGAFIDRLKADPAIDPTRIGVEGGSYGGYMCYASAIRFADALKGALCQVAISNFVSFLQNTAGYRQDLRRVEYGDERDPKQRAKLIEISPVRRIGEIKEPLFVVAGANDPRVPKSEADQIVTSLRNKGRTVWYMVGENEGHGFGKKENQDYLFWTSLMFWNQSLLRK